MHYETSKGYEPAASIRVKFKAGTGYWQKVGLGIGGVSPQCATVRQVAAKRRRLGGIHADYKALYSVPTPDRQTRPT
jgi:hypothetical protein